MLRFVICTQGSVMSCGNAKIFQVTFGSRSMMNLQRWSTASVAKTKDSTWFNQLKLTMFLWIVLDSKWFFHVFPKWIWGQLKHPGFCHVAPVWRGNQRTSFRNLGTLSAPRPVSSSFGNLIRKSKQKHKNQPCVSPTHVTPRHGSWQKKKTKPSATEKSGDANHQCHSGKSLAAQFLSGFWVNKIWKPLFRPKSLRWIVQFVYLRGRKLISKRSCFDLGAVKRPSVTIVDAYVFPAICCCSTVLNWWFYDANNGADFFYVGKIVADETIDSAQFALIGSLHDSSYFDHVCFRIVTLIREPQDVGIIFSWRNHWDHIGAFPTFYNCHRDWAPTPYLRRLNSFLLMTI